MNTKTKTAPVTMSMQLETVTPEMAKRMLQNNTKNRALKPRLVAHLVEDILNGDFKLTHQGIALDVNGNLIDGQHRLTAIVQANKPVQIYVSRGLAPEMMNVMDVGAKRTQADALGINGFANPLTLAAASQIYYAYLNKHIANVRDRSSSIANNFKLLEFIDKHPEIINSTQVISKQRRLNNLGSGAVMTAFHAIFLKKNKAKAEEFFRVLSENYSTERNHPALIFSDHILRRKVQGITIGRTYLMAALIRSWNNLLAAKAGQPYPTTIFLKDPDQIVKDFV